MATQLFTLSSEFHNIQVHRCSIDDDVYWSVMDIIKALTGPENANGKWRDMKKKKPDLQQKCKMFQFLSAVKGSPIATKPVLDQIIGNLPRAKVNNIKTQYENLMQRMETDTKFSEQNGKLLETKEKISKVARPFMETKFYIRISLPPQFVMETTHEKPLTIEVIKFGISTRLSERHDDYVGKCTDNGFFACVFSFSTKDEAELVEKFFRYDMKNLTTYNSFEYVHAEKVAGFLKMSYDKNDYKSYFDVANGLMLHVIKVAYRLWPDKIFDSKFTVYDIVAKTQYRLGTNCQLVDDVRQEDLQFEPRDRYIEDAEIDLTHVQTLYRHSLQMKQSTERKLSEALKRINELEGKGKVDPSTNATPAEKASAKKTGEEIKKPDRRGNGEVIARDIFTGEETVFKNVEQAAYSVSLTPAALKRSLLGKQRQFEGKHWRELGHPFWIPMDGLQFNPSNKSKVEYIKAVDIKNPKDIRVYENITEASRILQIDRRSISDKINDGKVYKGYTWSKLPTSQWGKWSEHVQENELQVYNVRSIVLPSYEERLNLATDDGKNGRCNGKIVARNLKTGAEIVYPSKTKAAAAMYMAASAMEKKVIDKCKQIKGYSFRKIESEKVWSPPDYFVYDDSTWQKKTGGYVVCEFEDGSKKMYESIKCAADFTGIDKSKITEFKNTLRFRDGKRWRDAKHEEYHIFVPV